MWRPSWKTVVAETAVAIVLGVAAGALFLYGARLMAERRAQQNALTLLDQTQLTDGARENAIAKMQAALTESREALAARDRAAGERDRLVEKLKSAEEENRATESCSGICDLLPATCR